MAVVIIDVGVGVSDGVKKHGVSGMRKDGVGLVNFSWKMVEWWNVTVLIFGSLYTMMSRQGREEGGR